VVDDTNEPSTELGMDGFDDDTLDDLLAALHQRLIEAKAQQALLTAPKVTN
jgi:hypothetical protein